MAITAAYPVFNALGVAFLLLPSQWHWRARNWATLLFIFWSLILVIPSFINSLVWWNSTTEVIPVWCDIVTKLRIGADVGLPASSLCMTRHLEAIAAARQVHYTVEDRRKRMYHDMAVALGLPVLVMILHTVVQGHRFDIAEKIGCVPTVFWSLPAIFLVDLWPIVLYTVAAVYAALALRLFIVRRYQFAKILESSQSALSPHRFLRLIALALFQILFCLPLNTYLEISKITTVKLYTYPSWSYVHTSFSTVLVLNTDGPEFTSSYRATYELGYWAPAVSCIAFFLFFGMGDESLAAYKGWITTVRRFARTPPAKGSTASSTSTSGRATQVTLPAYSVQHKSDVDDSYELSKVAPEPVEALPYNGVRVTVMRDGFSSV